MTLTLTALLLTLIIAVPVAQAGKGPKRVAAQLNRNLAGTPMAGLGVTLERKGRQYGVHPAFIAAVAGLESAWGRLPCRTNPRNVWGLGSCDRAWTPPRFRSWPHAIGYFARFIRQRWPHARTPYDLHGYCECGSVSWGSRVAWNMQRLGFPAVVRYGRA